MNKISIIVPIFNSKKYLDRCIQSIINQTYKEIEIVLVNDGSEDNSLEICSQYMKKDNRIKIVSQKNCGLSSARNTGLKNATGNYIMFVDSDDWIDRSICEKLLKESLNNDCDIVFCSYVECYTNKSIFKNIIETDKPSVVYNKEETKTYLLRRTIGLITTELYFPKDMDTIVSAGGKLYKKELISNIFFVDTKEIGTEDILFNIEVLGKAKKSCYLNENLYNYWRSNDDSLTRNFDFSL